jgi:hypothetical protein
MRPKILAAASSKGKDTKSLRNLSCLAKVLDGL